MTSSYSAIRFSEGPLTGARYLSGNVVFDEAFIGGRLVTRYWNANGQVLPEMYYEKTSWGLDQPADTFRLAIDHRDLAGGFSWESAGLEADSSSYRPLQQEGKAVPISHGVITLIHAEAGIQVKVHTRLDGSAFIIRWLEITNLNAHPLGITALSPFSGSLWAHRYEEHIADATQSPFELAYNHLFEWGREGDFWFEPLADGIKHVDGEKKGRSGWGRPAFWVKDRCNGQIFVCELAWGGNYEFALDCRLKGANWGSTQVHPANRMAELYFNMSLSAQHEVLRVLDAGETLSTPAVHMALFHEPVDGVVQATHEHVRQVVMPAQIPGREVEIEANHRGYLCDRENVPDIIKDVDVAASLGVEMYVIDAGWYGKDPNHWGNNAGDWQDGSWMAKGGGLKAVVDHVHSKGLKFGLWVEVEAAGVNSTLKSEHPDWLLKSNGEPVANGRALDLSQPVVAAWVESEIERLIRTYDLDMFRIDHNHQLQPAGNRSYQGYDEDLIWRYYEALYGIFDRARARFPKVVFQNCAGGGGRLDWGTLARFHNTELSDWMRLPRGLKILNGVTFSLPPEILLRTFGTEVGEHVLDGDVDAQMRTCFCRIIFRGIAPSLDELSPYLREHIEHYLELYKDFIRPVMRDGLMYHHTPFLSHSKVTPWCVLEYAKADASASVAVVFRTADTTENDSAEEYVYTPRGLNQAKTYHIQLDSARQKFVATGRELIQQGIQLHLEPNLSSELVMISLASPG